MLDIELVTAPIQTGIDIVSLAEMKKHVRVVTDALDDQITAAVNAAADELHGLDGTLNRTVFPCRWVRYLRTFPATSIIQLPYPPLIGVVSVAYENGESPPPVVDPSTYIVRKGNPVPQIELLPSASWPTLTTHPRAVAVTFDAGYETYPPKLKDLVKILAAHKLENPEATINEMRQAMTNRAVLFGVDELRSALRIPVAYDDWN